MGRVPQEREAVVLHLEDRSMRDTDELANRHAEAIGRAIAAMRAPDPELLTLHDMADLACLSPFHFSRIFRRATGVPPGAFFAALQLDRAKRLLLNSELSVTEVCFGLGYESLGTFTTRFTRQVGLSPGRFRHLPEVTAELLGMLQEIAVDQPIIIRPGAPAIEGRVTGPAAGGGATFVGLFPMAMAGGRPVAGTVIPRPGPFALPMPIDGHYALLAVSLPNGCAPAVALAPDASSLVGSAGGAVVVSRGVAHGPTDVMLRQFLATDAPVLVALPPLLFGRPGGRGLSGERRKIEEVLRVSLR